MPQLNNIITSQAFELIRDRVGEILIDELANQFTLSGDTSINATVYVERSKPFDHTELPAVTVYMTRGSYDGNVVAQNGEYDIGIDFAQKAPGTDDNRGDQLSAIRLHKLMGVARAILMSSKYKTLGYDPGFIQDRKIIEIAISQPDTKDAHNTIFGRMVLRVKAAELAENSTPTIAAGYDTNIKLGLTEKGYIYSGENIPVSACSVLLAGLTPDQLNTCILPNYDFSDSTVIANLSAQQILDLQSQIGGGSYALTNSDGSYNDTISENEVLPDVTHIDSNGDPVVWPGMKPFIASQEEKTTEVIMLYTIDSELSQTFIVAELQAGSYTSITTTNVDSYTIIVNGVVILIVDTENPLNLALGDEVELTIVRSAIGEADLKMTGTYA